jgi:hypothetical protein
MLKHCFLMYEKHNKIALRHLAVCTKTFFILFFFVFLEVLTKTEYCHIEFCIFSNIKILPDINQNEIKNMRENCKIMKKYFLNVFLISKVGRTWPKSMGWAELGRTRRKTKRTDYCA